MSLRVNTLRILVKDVLRSSGPGSEVRIQVRDKGGFWRDHSSTSANPESVLGIVRATESATWQPVRAIDHSGRLLNFH